MLSPRDELLFNASVGLQVRTRRRAMGYSTIMVSEQLGIPLAEYLAAETGETAFSILQTSYLAYLLDLPVGSFFAEPATDDAMATLVLPPPARWSENRGAP